jgi:hypothetical protein
MNLIYKAENFKVEKTSTDPLGISGFYNITSDRGEVLHQFQARLKWAESACRTTTDFVNVLKKREKVVAQ